MAYSSGYKTTSVSDNTYQPVAIVSVDAQNRRASGRTRNSTEILIDISQHVGGLQVTPALGEQWYAQLTRGVWTLMSKIPFNAPEMNNTPALGQVQIGSTGPLELNAGQVNANGPLRLLNTVLPDASTVDPGSILYDVAQSIPMISNGTIWNQLGGKGIQGEQGIQGVQGIQGATGLTGPAGMIWQGIWDAGTTYAVNDAVSYNGSSYIATAPISPGDAAPEGNFNWQLLAAGGTGGGVIGGGGSDIDQILVAKGDLLSSVGPPPGNLVRVPVGTDATVLCADSSKADGLVWTSVTAAMIAGLLNPNQIPLLGDLLGTLLPSQIVEVDAAVINGILDPSSIPLLSNLLGTLNPSQIAGTLAAGQVPVLSALLGSLNPSQILGILAPGQVPTLNNLLGSLDPTQILGTLSPGQIPVLSALGGILTPGQVPNLNDLLGSLDASQVLGTFTPTQIPVLSSLLGSLNPSQILGTLLPAQIPNITAAMSTDLQGTWNSIVSALNGPSTGNVLTDVEHYLQNIPAENVIGAITTAADQALRDAIAVALGHPAGATAPQIQSYMEAIPIPNINNLGGYLTNLSPLGVLALDGLALGALPVGITIAGVAITGTVAAGIISGALSGATIGVTALTGLAAGILAWLTGGGALPSGTTMGASGLTGLATGVATWITSGGALPSATTLGVGGLTGVAAGIGSWLISGGALPAATTLAATGLTSGAIPAGVTLATTGLTGLATGVGTWLTGGGALPSATTLGATGLTGLASGVLAWLTGGGALPSPTTIGVSGLTGLGTGVATWLIGAAALPSTTTAKFSQILDTAGTHNLGSYLTNISSGGVLSGFGNVIDGGSNPLSSYLTNMTSAGVFTPLQQIIDGTVGGTNNPPSSLITLINNISVRFFSEIPTGAVNGVNTLYNLAQAATSGTLQFFVNGVLQTVGSDYTVSGAAVTLANAPGVGDVVHAMYQVGTTGGGMPYATIDSLMQSITGAVNTGGGGMSGMSTWFTDLTGLMGSPTGLGTGTPILPGVNNIPILGPVQSQITSFIGSALGPGGSSFPWQFPLGFGNQTTTMGQVGNQISNGEHLAQQVLDTVVQQYTGTTSIGNSIQQLVSALNQQPGPSLGSVIPAEILPDITTEMSSGIQAAQNVANTVTSDLSSVLEYAQQESAQALGSFINTTSVQTALANVVSQGSVDTFVSLLNGIPVIGAPLAQLASSFSGHLTGLVNNWTGSTLATAGTQQVNAAAANALNQQINLNTLLTAINSQLPHFYGGGNTGLSFQQTFSGSMPSGWTTPLTPGAGLVYNCALLPTQQAATDTQTVSGIWSVADNYPKMLILRSNAAMTSYTYAIIQSNTSTNNCRIGVVVGGVNTPLGSAFGLPGSGAFVASNAYNFEAVGRLLTLSGPNGLNQSVTDTGGVGQMGANYRYGGFGTGGTSLGVSGWGGATSGTFTPPAGMVVGDQYEVAAVGAGGGGGGGVGTWGNGGGAGQLAVGLVTIGSSIGPAVGQQFTYYAGGGGGAGQSLYYVVQYEEYYLFGGNSGLQTNTASNAAYPGAAGDVAYIQWPSPTGTQQIYCAGGTAGAAAGGSPTGAGPGSQYVNGDLFGGGAATAGYYATNGAAPDYNGGNGNNYGGGGTGCYSGTAQTNGQDYHDSSQNHWIWWYYGINAWQYAGAGAPGAAWITPISRQLPGSMASWAFYDSAVAGPTQAQVATGETCTSTTWSDLATTTDQVTVNIGPSGMCLVSLSALVFPATSGQWGMMGVALSGANTLAPQDSPNNYAIGSMYLGSGMWSMFGNTFLLQGLNQGATVFKAKYEVSGGSCAFYDRAITVLPL